MTKRLLSLTLSLIMALSIFLTFEIPEAKAYDNVLSYMVDSHPRLQVTNFDDIWKKIETDSYAAALYATIKAYADYMLDQPAYEKYHEEKLALFKHQTRIIQTPEVVSRFYAMSLVAAMEKDNKKYVDRLWLEVEKAINLPNWNHWHWLETSQMIQAVSIAYDWCYDYWTDEQRSAMENGIKTLGLDKAVNEYEGDTTWYQWHTSFTGTIMENNWNMVCNMGVVFGSIALADIYPDFCNEMLNNAVRSISDGLLEFYPDGGYPEGTGYWNFALTNTIAATSAIESAFGGFDNLPEIEEPHHWNFLEHEGVGDAGDYATYMCGAWGSNSVNYGDCTPSKMTSSAQVYLATRLNKPEQLLHFMTRAAKPGALIEDYERYDYQVQALLYYEPMELTTEGVSLDKNFDLGISTMRNSWTNNRDTVFVAMKAGYAGGPHQHHDVGCFAIDALGQRWIKTPGAINYGWANSGLSYVRRPEGNNVLIVNPDETRGQLTENGKTPLINSGSSTDEGFFVYDMTPTYEGYVEEYRRGIKLFDNRSRILVQDEVVFSEDENELWWFAKTDAELGFSKDAKSVVMSMRGDKMLARILAPADATFVAKEAAPLPESPDLWYQPATYGTKLAINLTEQTDETTIAVEFIPLMGNQAPPKDTPKVIPMTEWSVKGKEETVLSSFAGSMVAMMDNSPLAYSNGTKNFIDSSNPAVTPIMRNDRNMVPLRFISEAMDGDVSWNDELQEVTVNCDFREVKVKIGDDFITVDGEQKPIDSPAFLENGRTYVPLRAISEALGKHVDYDNGLVLISDTEKPFKTHSKLYDELKDILKYDVEVNGEKAFYFDPQKTEYNIFDSGNNSVKVKLLDGSVIEETGDKKITISLDGKNYTFNFVQDDWAITKPYLTSLNLYCVEEKEYVPEGGSNSTHIPIVSVTDTANDGNIGKGAFDSSLGTRWSGQTSAGDENSSGEVPAYLIADFGEPKKVTHMHAAWYAGSGRQEIFEIETSLDGENWTPVFSGMGNGLTNDMQLFELEPTEARYVRYVGLGNTKNSFNSVTEIRYYSSLADAEADAEDWEELNGQAVFPYVTGETYTFAVEGVMSNGEIVKYNPSDVTFMVNNGDYAYIDENGVLEVYEPELVMVYAYVNDGNYQRKARAYFTAE